MIAYAGKVTIHVPRLTRRRFLGVLGQGALLASLPPFLRAAEDNEVTISLLHTTDLHGHILPTTDYAGHPDLGGLARCATQIRRWRAENPHSLLLDIGDVYQGTQVGLSTRGEIMIRCLNALGYDGWVVGNHEFDWGTDTLADCVKLSAMPVLSGNALVEGRPVGKTADSAGPLARLQPYLIKDVAGFRIAIIGLTTPTLSSWLPPENLRGYEALDPAETLRALLGEVAAHQPDAIVLVGHMGLKRRDDEANPVGALTREFPQLAVCLGGHTHQNHPGEWINRVLYTQADHFGIYAGKVDLTFDRGTRRLLRREAVTVPMDSRVALDPLVLSLARHDLDLADEILARPIGATTEPFDNTSSFSQPGGQERLIGSAIVAALRQKNIEIDAVVHGLSENPPPLGAGPKTVADAWTILPYENPIVTVKLAYPDLLAVAQELATAREIRPLMGVRTEAVRENGQLKITALRAHDGSPLPVKPVYRLALNSYDSQSGGGRFPLLAQLAAQPSNRRAFYPVTVRDALIDFFLAQRQISRASLLV